MHLIRKHSKLKGLGGVLEEVIEKTNGSEEAISKLFGSSEALLGVLALSGDKFKGYNKALEQQKNGLDAVRNAFDQNADTIAGSLARVGNAITGLITSGQGLSRALIPVFDGLAAAIEALNGPIGIVVAALGGLALAWYAAAKAAGVYAAAQAAASGGGIVTGLIGLANALNLVGAKAAAAAAGKTALASAMTAANTKIAASTLALGAFKVALLAIPWVAAAAGIAAIGAAIVSYNKKQAEMNRLLTDTSVKAKELEAAVASKAAELARASAELDRLTDSGIKNARAINVQEDRVRRLRAQLEALEGVYKAQVQVEIAISGFDQMGAGFSDELAAELAALGYNYTPGKEVTAISAPSFSGGGSSGGGGGGAAPTDDIAGLQRSLDLLNQIAPLQDRIAMAQLEGDQYLVARLEGEVRMLELKKQGVDAVEALNTEEGKRIQTQINQAEQAQQLVESQFRLLEIEKQRKEAVEGILQPIQDEITLLQARLNGNEEEIKQLIEIRNLKEQILAANPNADTSGVEAAVKQRDELKKQVEAADALKAKYEELADSIAGELTGAFRSIIDGSKSAEQALADAFQGIADAFLDMAMKMIQEWIKMQLLGIIGSAFGGAPAAGGGGGLLGGGLGANIGGSFADGGRPPVGKVSLRW